MILSEVTGMGHRCHRANSTAFCLSLCNAEEMPGGQVGGEDLDWVRLLVCKVFVNATPKVHALYAGERVTWKNESLYC